MGGGSQQASEKKRVQGQQLQAGGKPIMTTGYKNHLQKWLDTAFPPDDHEQFTQEAEAFFKEDQEEFEYLIGIKGWLSISNRLNWHQKTAENERARDALL